jgi:hypothetical protein
MVFVLAGAKVMNPLPSMLTFQSELWRIEFAFDSSSSWLITLPERRRAFNQEYIILLTTIK